MIRRLFVLVLVISSAALFAQSGQRIDGWQMQDASRVSAEAAVVSTARFKSEAWYAATVPGTVLTTLVDDHVYPEPLYGENMRTIPESLNKSNYWYRTVFSVPAVQKGRHTWLHFQGINYSAQIWVNGHRAGSMRGAFVRGDFDVSALVKPGHQAVLAVLVSPQPHPGVPHEHTLALGLGANGGESAIDGPTFLSTIGWDWLPAIRDRDTGIFLPVTMDSTGPVVVKDPFVTAELSARYDTADLNVSAELENLTAKSVSGMVRGTIHLLNSQEQKIAFQQSLTLPAHGKQVLSMDSKSFPQLHVAAPKLWWPNGYGPQNLYTLTLSFEVDKTTSSTETLQFGIRKIEYQVPDSENLTLAVNGVRIMARGGNWGLDEALKRVTRERLDAEFHLHALANLNLIRNWVGQSTSPDFYAMADKYGMLLWDEFFQPNPFDGPDPTDITTYVSNVTAKVLRYRNHPAIAVWCARNEGYPPKELDETLKGLMSQLDPTRLYQSNSAEGRGVSSHGPYYWRAPRFFYPLNESFKTETGSVSVPTIESIQGMMPEKDWETINDDWAQHDLAAGAQRGDEYPKTLAERYGHIRNLADFVRKAQMANYEAFRAMYEGRNAKMFKETTGIITWMSNPAQPSFVWQLYHYDLEPNAALYGAKKAAETVHIQLNEINRGIEVVNNRPEPIKGMKVEVSIYRFDGTTDSHDAYSVPDVPGSTTMKIAQLEMSARITPLYFIKLDLTDAAGKLISTNLYWQHVAQDQFDGLMDLPVVRLDAEASIRTQGGNTVINLMLRNNTRHVALLAHVQLHQRKSGRRVLPVFYSDNYVSLVPGESVTITTEVATKDLQGDDPLVEVDGYNVDVNPVEAPIGVTLNLNAQPAHWPETRIVP